MSKLPVQLTNLDHYLNWIKAALVPGQTVMLITPKRWDSLNLDLYEDDLYGSYLYAINVGYNGVQAAGENALLYLPKASLIIFIEDRPHHELTKLIRNAEVPAIHLTNVETRNNKVFMVTVYENVSSTGYSTMVQYLDELNHILSTTLSLSKVKSVSRIRGIFGKVKANWRKTWYRIVPARRRSRIYKWLKKGNYKSKA